MNDAILSDPDNWVIDCHVHVFPDVIAESAVQFLSEKSDVKPSYNGTRQGLLESMSGAGIRLAVNCPVATAARQVASINSWAAAGNSDPMISFGSVHPDFEDIPAELERVRSLGLHGIKIHPEYQEVTLGDPRMDPCWDTCSELGLPVLMHLGADIGFDPPYHSSPGELADLLNRYPRLKVIAGHFGGWRMWDDVATYLLGRDVYLDTSFTQDYLAEEQFTAMIRKHGIERVLFGTDAPWRDQKAALDQFHSLPLSTAEKKRILWYNTAELLELDLQ